MWTEFNFLKQREELMLRDYSRVPVDDLAAAVALAGRLGDRGLLSRLGAACAERAKDFKAAHWEAFLQLGRHYASSEVRDYPSADQSLRAAVKLAGKVEPGASIARLGLAVFLLDVVGNPIEAGTWLGRVTWKELPSAEVARWQVARADVQMALGLTEAARRILTALSDPPDPKTEIARQLARRAKLEAARDYLRRGEYAATLDALDELEETWAPERMSLEVGLLRAKVFKGRGEYPRAVSLCRRMLSVAGGQNIEDARAELLYTLIDTERAMGRTQQADREFTRLLEEHPLSEAAARGKEAWGMPEAEGQLP
jgi:tetratricopeptide (TPR) repeat protein